MIRKVDEDTRFGVGSYHPRSDCQRFSVIIESDQYNTNHFALMQKIRQAFRIWIACLFHDREKGSE